MIEGVQTAYLQAITNSNNFSICVRAGSFLWSRVQMLNVPLSQQHARATQAAGVVL
jgi:hypothetical protein